MSDDKQFGQVSWSEEDLITALKEAELEPTPERLEKLMASYFICNIEDAMVEAGWGIIHLAIDKLKAEEKLTE